MVNVYGKCRYEYIPYMDPMGSTNCVLHFCVCCRHSFQKGLVYSNHYFFNMLVFGGVNFEGCNLVFLAKVLSVPYKCIDLTT